LLNQIHKNYIKKNYIYLIEYREYLVTKSNRDSQMDDPEIVEFNVGGNIVVTTDENLRYLNNFLFIYFLVRPLLVTF